MRSLALANQKGGVGKTTTAIHLAHGLAMAGARVALFDLDPQGNASVAVQGMEVPSTETEGPLSWMRQMGPSWWLMPSPGAERNLGRDARLDTDGLVALASQLEGQLDWLVVDCPPRMDQWGWAGLRLCREVLVPVQAEFFSMQGLSHMMQTLEQARREYPGRATLHGVLVTMLDAAEPIAREIVGDLRDNLGPDLLQTLIFRDPRLVEAASHGRTLFEYDIFSKGARSYGELVREVMHGRTPTG